MQLADWSRLSTSCGLTLCIQFCMDLYGVFCMVYLWTVFSVLLLEEQLSQRHTVPVEDWWLHLFVCKNSHWLKTIWEDLVCLRLVTNLRSTNACHIIFRSCSSFAASWACQQFYFNTKAFLSTAADGWQAMAIAFQDNLTAPAQGVHGKVSFKTRLDTMQVTALTIWT